MTYKRVIIYNGREVMRIHGKRRRKEIYKKGY